LATVQSICADDHWLGVEGQWERVPGQDCEEEFCEVFDESHAPLGDSYLAAGLIDGSYFASWCAQTNPSRQRLFLDRTGCEADQAERAGQRVLMAAELMKSREASAHVAVVELLGRG
jgi:hypothetical protein